jgi:hypothetical protein
VVWFKVDDKIHSHPKARRAGLAAMGLWSLAGSHCMDYLTDGIVEHWFVDSWPEGRKLAAALVDAGLWNEHPQGWTFHDWAEFQPTRDKVLSGRAATRERVERWRNERRNGVTNDVGTTAPSPSPSPDLTKTSKSQSRSNRARVSTDRVEVSEMTRRLASQQGITSLPTVVDVIQQFTACTVTADQAFQVSMWILGKAKDHPRSPQQYVSRAIQQSPAEVEQHIFEAIA